MTWLPVVAVAALAGCGVGEAEEAPIQTAVATRMNLNIVAEAAGTLEPIRRVDVMSKASGEVINVLVDTGEKVEAGTLLAEVDPRDVQNELNQIQADYEVTRQRFANAQTQFERSKELLDAGVITEQEHETRNLDLASQQAAYIRAQQSLYLAQIRREDVTVRAPLTGTVLSKTVEEGQVISSPSGNVSGGTVLFTIAELEVLQVRSLVNESDVGRILPGMAASIKVDAFPDRTFQGQVEKIEPQASVSQSVVNYPVIVQLSNADGTLKPGMSANITIRLQERPNALTVPNHAIVTFAQMETAATYLGIPEERLIADQAISG
jgi:HlyD family secretion protein